MALQRGWAGGSSFFLGGGKGRREASSEVAFCIIEKTCCSANKVWGGMDEKTPVKKDP